MNIRGVLAILVVILGTVFWGSLAIVGSLFRAGRGYNDFCQRSWARCILWTAGIRVTVEGMERLDPEGGQLILANHQSMMDIWVLIASLPSSIRFVAKQELAKIPFLAGSMKSVGHVFIDRSNRSAAIDAIRAASERIRDAGLTLVMFPEGTRSRDGTLGRFKKGPFALAIQGQLEIVPIAILGTGRLYPPSSRWPRRGEVTLKIASTVPTTALTIDDRDATLDAVRETVGGLLDEAV